MPLSRAPESKMPHVKQALGGGRAGAVEASDPAQGARLHRACEGGAGQEATWELRGGGDSPAPLCSRCECPPGYSGKLCEVDVDDCAAHSCRHGAPCVDAVNGYTCTCPQGFRYGGGPSGRTQPGPISGRPSPGAGQP